MDTMMPNEPRAIRRLALEQVLKLAEAAREEARADDPISNEALYQRLVAPRKLASVVEPRRSKPASVVEPRRSKPASMVEPRRSKPASALVSAANHTFWIIVLAILVVRASPLE